MQLFPIDEKREIAIVDSEENGAIFAAIRFISIGQKAISRHKSFSVALSGGSTPKKLYEKLLLPQYANGLNWSQTKVFWSDERIVPLDDPESNYGMAMRYFSKEPLDESKKFPMYSNEKELVQAAANYEKLIKKQCFEERFDLMLLGIGDDGHTASLFPHTEALKIENALAAPNYVEQKKCWRLTLTYPCINNARNTIVLAYGAAKAHVLKKILLENDDPDTYPAQKIGRGKGTVLFIIDKAAAAELSL